MKRIAAILGLTIMLAACSSGGHKTLTPSTTRFTTTTVDTLTAMDRQFVDQVRKDVPSLTANKTNQEVINYGSTICGGIHTLGSVGQLMDAVRNLASTNDPALMGASMDDIRAIVRPAVNIYCPEFKNQLNQL